MANTRASRPRPRRQNMNHISNAAAPSRGHHAQYTHAAARHPLSHGSVVPVRGSWAGRNGQNKAAQAAAGQSDTRGGRHRLLGGRWYSCQRVQLAAVAGQRAIGGGWGGRGAAVGQATLTAWLSGADLQRQPIAGGGRAARLLRCGCLAGLRLHRVFRRGRR